jgi:hypothetical protein
MSKYSLICTMLGCDCKVSIGNVSSIGLNGNGILVSGSFTLDQIRQMNIRDGISFGPTLIKNGVQQITHGDGGKGIAPPAPPSARNGTAPFYCW